MRRIIGRIAVIAGLATAAGLTGATPAEAQHVCSGRPDEVMIGVGRGGPGVAGPPLCQWVSQPGQSQQAPVQRWMPDYYMAVAIHRDSSDIWATWGYGSNDAAEKAALKGCARAMGEGCEIAAGWSNAAEIAIARDVAGNLWAKGADAQSGDAKRLALTACREASTGCEAAGAVTNAPNRGQYFPPAPKSRRHFAVVAWPKQDPGPDWRDKVWLVSGIEGYHAAEQAVLQRCRTESGSACEVGKWDADGALVRSVNEARKSSWLRVSDPAFAKHRTEATCPENGLCVAVEVYDSRTPRALTIDVTKAADYPIRGFYSIAWPQGKSPWDKLAVVTGQPTREGADAAAVALCEKDSGGACEPYMDDGDLGYEQFVVVLKDSANNVRAHFGLTPAEAQQKKQASCAKYGVSCPEGRMIDLSVPARLVVDY